MPTGFRSVENSTDGFALGLPASFSEIPLTAAGLDSAADQLSRSNPALAEMLRNNKSLIGQARLFAFDPSTGNNQLVQKIAVPGARGIADIPAGTFSSEYRQLGATSIAESRVSLPAGEAVKVTAVLTVGTRNVSITQHVLVRDSVAWVLTYSESVGAAGQQASAIASTFRWI